MIKYNALVLLASIGNFSDTWLQEFLTQFVNKRARSETIKPSIKRFVSGTEDAPTFINIYTLTWSDGWNMHFYLTSEPHVLVESTKLAEDFAKEHSDQAIIAACAQRIEISSNTDDDMLHFNDFVYIQEAFCKVPHAYVWEAATEAFQN
jgi:hypothetical protein